MDKLDDLMEENYSENEPAEPIIEEKEIPYWEKADFDWENKNMWIILPTLLSITIFYT